MSERDLDTEAIDVSTVLAQDIPGDEPSIDARPAGSLADDHGLDIDGGKQQTSYNDPFEPSVVPSREEPDPPVDPDAPLPDPFPNVGGDDDDPLIEMPLPSVDQSV